METIFRAAIEAAKPSNCLLPFLPPVPKGRTVVVGAGKAAASMARAVEMDWPQELTGLVVTRYGHKVPTRYIEVLEASHPLPDEAGLNAARRMIEMVSGLAPDDLVLCLISGGGSALLTSPLDGVSLGDKQEISKALLRSGATIAEINCVRRHLSAVKGGRLGLACYPASVVTLLISDVPGDHPADIASGPTVPDATTCADALAVIGRYDIRIGDNVRRVLESGLSETVKPEDFRLSGHVVRVIATAETALKAAARKAAQMGLPAYILGDAIEGEAKTVGTVMAGIALHVAKYAQPFQAPCILLSGGETTVTVRGRGRGGRNVEFLMSLGLTLNGHPGIYAIAGDTDGVDGQDEIAGALLTPDSIKRAQANKIDLRQRLEDNDGHGFFQLLGDSIVTGPTLTNVNDFRAILITSEARDFYKS